MRPAAAVFAVLLLTASLAGCAGKGTQQVSNNPDNFRYTATWEGKSGQESFAWPNSRDAATVSVPKAGSSGSLTVRVLDANGAQVFQRGLDGESLLGERTSTGAQGTWRIELGFAGFTGDVDVRVLAAAAA